MTQQPWPSNTRVDVFKTTIGGFTNRYRFMPHSGKAAHAPQLPLDLYSDAALIAELERRTKVALARPQLELKRKPNYGPYDDWRTKARHATDKLEQAIKCAGLRP